MKIPIPREALQIERTVPDYPGASSKGVSVEMTPEVAKIFKTALDKEAPVIYGRDGLPLAENTKSFGVKSQMSMAIYPRTGKPWQFGIHQCSFDRSWQENDIKLFHIIGVMTGEALGNLLFSRDLQKANQNLAHVVERQSIEIERSNVQYESLFNGMINGCALHEIICDADNQPVDYRFLAINPAFEKLTGLKSEDLLGNTVLEVLPGTEKFWIDTYGKVAQTGVPVHFENYSSELNKYFMISAYRPAENQFACIVADITEEKNIGKERERLVAELQRSLREIKTLRGIIPICSQCHKIRNDEGFWQQVDLYIAEHSEAVFSHGMCMECSDKLYGGLDWYDKGKKDGSIK